jgi:hypothetical protein
MNNSNTNHLAQEKSPYLKSQADSPVAWYPWGKEAFEKAKREDKPILLSIGYATCHWCHVMERETFRNSHVAEVLNSTFVNIKIDREEFPEIDSLYMEMAQIIMSTSGGWPLNVICTSDLKPFFAVTYLPPQTKEGLIGFAEIAKQIQLLWNSEERNEIVMQADKILELFQESTISSGSIIPDEDDFEEAIEELFDNLDATYGGLKGEPKFPMSYVCDFFLNLSYSKADSRALFFAELTLEQILRGGLHDHLGGGFSRYTIDALWHIPHFEKMLIDNAILATSYLQAWKLTRNDTYKEISHRTLEYILATFACPEGGLYSSEDADSNDKEGLYYTWALHEILDVLPDAQADIFCTYYNVTAIGNFNGRNVLHSNFSLEELSESVGISEKKVTQLLSQAKEKLLLARKKRPQPFRDEKIVASSNGFAIHALALAGRAFEESRYVDMAIKTGYFLKDKLWIKGKLLRRYCDGEARFPAGLDDYAALIKGALTLFETGCGTEFLQWALDLTERVEIDFKEENGAFYQADPEEEILLRKCDFYDGAEPSGNAVHAENLLRLYQITQDKDYLHQAQDIFKAIKEYLEIFPPGACYHLMNLNCYLDSSSKVIVIALDKEAHLKGAIMETLFTHFSPHRRVIWKYENDSLIDHLLPELADKKALNGKTTVYICGEHTCSSALQEKEEILNSIKEL